MNTCWRVHHCGVKTTAVLALGLFLLAGCQKRANSSAEDNRNPREQAERDDDSAAHQSDSLSAFDEGVEGARESIRLDQLVLKEYPPLPYPPGHNLYTALLKSECNVESVVGRPGDVPEQQFIEQVRGWNSVMRAEIEKRFGADVFERLQAEAQNQFKESLKGPFQP